ncbi:MAG: signal recognition particle-docking protein FtsY [Lachnospiraceae bacterium]|nr:signal recognition particle-docking protein FtsY [Lachnospiraceae bacterium]
MSEKQKTGFFKKLAAGLSKTRKSVVANLENLFMGVTTIDESFFEELEEILIMGDLGVSTTETIVDDLREKAESERLLHPDDAREEIIELLRDQMTVPAGAYDFEKGPSVVFVTGVNGVGKTTSIGKLAALYKQRGKNVLVAACDTFRAAAIDQLAVWCERAGVPMISQKAGSDPSSVLFDALQAAKNRNADILLCDTAGRLHNKKNLMEELRKMDRVISREYPEAIRENLLVLDATTGQNAISQAKEFSTVSELSGIILTKMDGTAKGGIAIAIQHELGIPVKYIGVGEKIDDLERFDSDEFIEALFLREDE